VRIEYLENTFCGDFRGAIMDFSDNADDSLLPERHQNAATGCGAESVRKTVGKDRIDRHWYGYITVFRHVERGSK
jgi:hypothetical protein